MDYCLTSYDETKGSTDYFNMRKQVDKVLSSYVARCSINKDRVVEPFTNVPLVT